MPRNLDLTALRSFVTVAEAGGVTRAAGLMNLTQSAVSMQLKRLEESLGLGLLDRTARTIGLTPAGEQLLGYARRMLAVNDEIYARLTAQEFEGELRLGVPHDVIYPAIPRVLREFAKDFPRMRVRLISANTRSLKEMFARGEADVIITTEDRVDADGETLTELPLVWIGALDGTAWRVRPLPIAFCTQCIFHTGVLRHLNAAEIPWIRAVESDTDNAVKVSVSADLAVRAALASDVTPQTALIQHGGALPDLGLQRINMYLQRSDQTDVTRAIAAMIRAAYGDRAAHDGAARTVLHAVG